MGDQKGWIGSAYEGVDAWLDSDDLAAISLPGVKRLMGESMTWKGAVMGLVNQFASRNILLKAAPAMDPGSLHALKPLLAGLLYPLEEIIVQQTRLRSEGFFRNMGKATVASLIAGALGPAIGNTIMTKK